MGGKSCAVPRQKRSAFRSLPPPSPRFVIFYPFTAGSWEQQINNNWPNFPHQGWVEKVQQREWGELRIASFCQTLAHPPLSCHGICLRQAPNLAYLLGTLHVAFFSHHHYLKTFFARCLSAGKQISKQAGAEDENRLILFLLLLSLNREIIPRHLRGITSTPPGCLVSKQYFVRAQCTYRAQASEA